MTEEVFREQLFMNTHTHNEVRVRLGAKPYEESFPDELKFLGLILGNLIINESMIEVNKMIIKVQLESYKIKQISSFSSDNASKLTIRFVVGKMCGIDNKGLNDFVAFMLQLYFSMLETYTPDRLLN